MRRINSFIRNLPLRAAELLVLMVIAGIGLIAVIAYAITHAGG